MSKQLAIRHLPLLEMTVALANAGVVWSANVFQENGRLIGAVTVGLVLGKLVHGSDASKRFSWGMNLPE